ncbi:hypothetical protein NQ318_013049 [Aromia moschata]|uniref:PiggyBac transposable element-derived protein domain-containing protein n=1 Tax=Aromia moschata TaxID=1265417 RepID=A0AAV8XP44_9CUCU|nr:hypothetical protein NQ318_013049 [Aromia moschata]
MSIDESMVPYFGRHGTKQFITGKPIRYGYKVWSLCDPCGYLIQFDAYQGKQNNRPNSMYKKLGYGYTGTINPNRTEHCPLPSTSDVKKTPRGTYTYITDISTGITVTSWNDNRPVLTVSSCDPVQPIAHIARRVGIDGTT